jgi:tetratricopeptide (TPR) repeat protein
MKRLLPILFFFGICPSLVSQTHEERIGLRMIAVRTEAEATSLRRQIQTGASFEALAREHSVDASSSAGGYMGLLQLNDLRAELQRALDGLTASQISAVTKLGDEFVLLERLSAEETDWIVSNEAGLQAFQQGRYEEAAQNFGQAVERAGKLKPVDNRLEDSLHGLAEAYRLEKKYSEAEPVYRRYLALHWGGSSAPEVLDRFSALLAVAYFRDAQFAETLRKFDEGVDRVPLGEDLYQAMSAILFKAQLLAEAETLMVRAARLFPESKDVRYHLAQLYRSSVKPKKALEVFEQVSRMKAPASIDPAVDRLQQSVVYQKIGSIHAEFAEFDEAMAAYKKALELIPDSVESRLGIGDIYLQQGRPQDALAEYSKIIAADPANATAHSRIADANLSLGRFAEAAAAAAKVLSSSPENRRAHYVRGIALARMDKKEEAEKELELFRKLEAENRSEGDRAREIIVLNSGAAAKLLEGHPEEAIETFLKIIDSYPDVSTHYVNLGVAQSKLGEHKAAVDTFQKMLNRGLDSFLVSRNLSQEYKVLGDMEASRRHEVVYLQNIDLALREALDWNLE